MSVACDVDIKEEIKEEPLNFDENSKDGQLPNNKASNLGKSQCSADPIEAIYLPENIKEEKLDAEVEEEEQKQPQTQASNFRSELREYYLKDPCSSPDDCDKTNYFLDANPSLEASKESSELIVTSSGSDDEAAFPSERNFQPSYCVTRNSNTLSVTVEKTILPESSSLFTTCKSIDCKKKKTKLSNRKGDDATRFQNSLKKYISKPKSEKLMKKTRILPPCTAKCRLGCSNKFSDDQRREIYNSFWKLCGKEKQEDFIMKNIDTIKPKYMHVRSIDSNQRRHLNHAFYFHKEEQKARVCRLFFVSTLGIGGRALQTILKKRAEENYFENTTIYFTPLKGLSEEISKTDKTSSQSDFDPVISNENNTSPSINGHSKNETSSDCETQTLTLTRNSSVTSIYESAFDYNEEREATILNRKTDIAKHLRNSGKEYISASKSGKLMKGRELLPPCTSKCRLGCSSKFTDVQRREIFNFYWDLSNIEKQRTFIVKSIETIHPKYRYIRSIQCIKLRNLNHAFYFFKGEEKVRVCKLFFKNTLGVNDRPIRTVLDKMISGVSLEDRRGKYKK